MNIRPPLYVLCAFALLLAACGDDTKAKTDASDTTTDSADTAPDTDTSDVSGDMDMSDGDMADVDECGGCPGVTVCEAGQCVYDPTVHDVCDPTCREDTQMCVAGTCRQIGTRDCYDDSHCTNGIRSGGAVKLTLEVPGAAETCVGGDPMAGTPGVCTMVLEETKVCPGLGAEGCEEVGQPGALRAGAAKRAITTSCGDCGVGFELPNPANVNADAEWSGSVIDPTTFFDCGRDQLCPGDMGYTAPDDGEGDGIFQGLFIPGFSYSRPASGVHDDLWARTVILEQDNVKIGFVALDTVGWFSTDIQRLEALLPADLGLDHIIYHATHNHESFDTMGQWGPGDYDGDLPANTGRDNVHLEFVYQAIVDSLVEANGNLVEVDLHVARANTGADMMKDGRDPVIFNDELLVVQLTETANPGTTVATLLNWHSHVESLWSENPLVSSDYPHYLRLAIENGLPAATDNTTMPATDYPQRDGLGGVAIFVAGSVGGLLGPGNQMVHDRDGTEYTVRGDYARTQAMGEVLAEFAFAALETRVTLADPELRFATKQMLMQVDNTQFHTAMFGLRLFDRPFYNFDGLAPVSETNKPFGLSRMTIMTLGELSFYTVPGELFAESAIGGYDGSFSFGRPIIDDPTAPFPPDLNLAPAGPYMNERVPGEYDFIVGLGEDTLGYFTPTYNYVLHESAPYFSEAEGDHYEETNGIGPTAEPQVNAVLDELIQDLWN